MKKKICFVLYNTSAQPSGGYKMVYTYANLLDSREFDVSIMFMNLDSLQKYPSVIRKLGVKYLTKIRPTWFKINESVVKISYYPNGSKTKYDFDYVIATELKTADFVAHHFSGLKKIYFIQDFENWGVSDKMVIDSYKLDMTKVVISGWLKKVVDIYSKTPSIIIKNPINLDVYRVIQKREDRSPYAVGMLYHQNEYKGCIYAIEALKIVKNSHPNLVVYSFGTADRPDDMPEWIIYKKNANQNETVEIYNNCSVWVCATIEEGFGLTGIEAMACGATLASTDYKGVREYARDKYNSLLSPIRDSNGLADNIIELINNKELRLGLSDNALEDVKAFSVQNSLDLWETVLD